ncbi:hypothetical protein SAY87_004786 [Trapa incisa]|uniref:Denticleless protein homolog n=1 Tax=Trapa incisa TaxID=236973 RepID=A0AAN7JPF0_9MYRT|nr:hypothetical protein SAY87_004786 [Trapa incisa]
MSPVSVRKRPHIFDWTTVASEIGAMAIDHQGNVTVPLSVSFGQTSKLSHVLAVSDEDGYVNLFDTQKKFLASASNQENSDRAQIGDWIAHQNAIFDICWIKDDSKILTASGDQTIRLWDVQERKCTGVLMGHKGSVKSLCPHASNSDIVVSGSRDGSFIIWDLRCNHATTSPRGELRIVSNSIVQGAHLPRKHNRRKRGKAASMSITSVLHLKDEVSLATAGAVDSIIKFWDTRNLKSQVTHACPHPESTTENDRRLYGVSSLSQDSNGVFLTASCMDNRIYLYNILQLEKGPIKSFSGSRIESFYVKAAISPDANQIVSGSSDGNAYVWQVDNPDVGPISLNSHAGEVTAVAWSESVSNKLATCSDDFTVRVWSIQSSYQPNNSKPPSAIRRRVTAMPTDECEKQLTGPEEEISTKHVEYERGPSSPAITEPIVRTPEGQKKKALISFDLEEGFKGTNTATAASPSSVLSPPSSVKRTIRDYFLVSSST